MQEAIAFEVYVDDVERAKQFYENAFNWKFQKREGQDEVWLIEKGEEKEDHWALTKRDPLKGKTTFVNTIEVPSIDEYLKKVEEAHGTVIVPKRVIAGMGWFSYFHDTEGNLFHIVHYDSSAR